MGDWHLLRLVFLACIAIKWISAVNFINSCAEFECLSNISSTTVTVYSHMECGALCEFREQPQCGAVRLAQQTLDYQQMECSLLGVEYYSCNQITGQCLGGLQYTKVWTFVLIFCLLWSSSLVDKYLENAALVHVFLHFLFLFIFDQS